jgi:hypothetical protein
MCKIKLYLNFTYRNIKKEDSEKAKLLEELTDKLNTLEKEKLIFTKHFATKEKKYLNKVKFLEKQIADSENLNMELLQKQNKEYENQITELKKMIERLNKKSGDDKSKFNDFAAQVIQLKEKLSKELKEVEKIKNELSRDDESENKSSKKIHIVMKDNPNNILQEVVDDMNLDKEDKNQPDKMIEAQESSSDSRGPLSSSIGDMSLSKKKNRSDENKQETELTENKNNRDNSKNKNKAKSSKSSSSVSSYSIK